MLLYRRIKFGIVRYLKLHLINVRIVYTIIYYLFIIYLFESGNMAHKKHEHDIQGQKMNDKNTNIKEHTKDTHTHRKRLK